MNEVAEMTPLIWLHVPLETNAGYWLKVPEQPGLRVLDRPARLFEREQKPIDPQFSASIATILQWLLFEPMSECEAEALLTALRKRMPALSFRQQAAWRIPAAELCKSPIKCGGIYNGCTATLIPGQFEPKPVWGEAHVKHSIDARGALEQQL